MEVVPREAVRTSDIYLLALDTVFYATRVCKRTTAMQPRLGQTVAKLIAEKQEKVAAQTKGTLPPSTVDALVALTSSDLYTTRPPHVCQYYDEANPQFYTAWHDGLMAAHPSTLGEENNEPPQFTPIATVEWDNKMLEWPTASVPLCESGSACAAMSLPGAPGPLPVYHNPGCDKKGQFCLLCIREDVEGLVLVSKAKAPVCGAGPCVQPPFKNLVGCPGGYKESVCSVVPGKQQVFVGGVHIVGTSGALQVRFNGKNFYVDQTPLIFDPLERDSFLGRGAVVEKRTVLL